MIDRRHMLGLAASALLPASAKAAGPTMSSISAWTFSFRGLKGGDLKLGDYAGKPVLVVNTASFCGYTPQYTTLQQLWTRYHDRGLMIIGVPSNDFGAQEPGDATQIEQVTHDLGVTFPLAAKSVVSGAGAHPFYKWAASEKPSLTPSWNFHKYLVGRDGHLAGSFATTMEPNDPRIIQRSSRNSRRRDGAGRSPPQLRSAAYLKRAFAHLAT